MRDLDAIQPTRARTMPPLLKESRQDEYQDRMPDTIHLATHVKVDSGGQPLIIEDVTGYEVIRGSYNVFVGRGERDSPPVSLVYAEPIEPQPLQDENNPPQHTTPPLVSKYSGLKTGVTRASSLLSLTSVLSDITFADELDNSENKESTFECVRISL